MAALNIVDLICNMYLLLLVMFQVVSMKYNDYFYHEFVVDEYKDVEHVT